jgi:predicted amidohydrolase YtcJ
MEQALNTRRSQGHHAVIAFLMVPNAMYLYPRLKSGAAVLAFSDSLVKTGTDKLDYVRAIKFYVDGAIFSQLMIMSQPYEDRHAGAWMMQPSEQEDVFDAFWKAGWDIHVHVNGDGGLDTPACHQEEGDSRAPDLLSTTYLARPAPAHR